MARKKQRYEAQPFESAKDREHYTPFYDSMIDSEKFKKLSSSARTVLLVLKRQYKGNYSEYATVVCPYSELNQYGLQNKTIRKALDELEQSGFIVTERGTRQCCGNLHRNPNRYKFVDKWWNDSG